MRRKISMKDIAKELGVSTTLVSYVLNDKYPGRIKAETAKKIKDYAKSVNYFPNHIAKSLKKDKTFTIGLIIADISNLFYSNIARIIEDESEKYMYNVIFGSADENVAKFKKLTQVFVSRQVDGIILAAPAGAADSIEYLKEQQIPFVLIDRFFPELSEINSITIDNYKASYEVVELLSRNSFKNPAMITLTSDLFHMKERTRGFREASIQILGTKAPKIVEIQEEKLFAEIESVLLELLKTGEVDVVYFSTNKIAMQAFAVFAKHKIKVPEQLGVICFDEADAYKIFNTSITYVRQPLKQMGREAVEILTSLINGEKYAKSVVFNTTIVQKDSTAKSP